MVLNQRRYQRSFRGLTRKKNRVERRQSQHIPTVCPRLSRPGALGYLIGDNPFRKQYEI